MRLVTSYLLIITVLFLWGGCSPESNDPGTFEFAEPGYIKNPHIIDPPPQNRPPAADPYSNDGSDNTEPQNGYIHNRKNAIIRVETMDFYQGDPKQYEHIYNWFMGGEPFPGGSTSSTTNIFIDWEGEKFYIYRPTFYFSILGYEWVSWTFTYELDGEKLSLDGISNWAYIGCHNRDAEASDSDHNSFHFEGTYDDSENKYQGSYEWREFTSGGLCDKKCTGQMSVLLTD